MLLLVGALGLAGVVPRSSRQPVWDLRRTVEPRRTGFFRDPHVNESSGVAASRRQPGILWTLNDSGDEARIYATDTLGRPHGALEVTDASNRDWEAIALGPCGSRDCLYIADTGDNTRDHQGGVIYRVPEPALPSARVVTEPAQALEFRYPRGRWDVEAAFVDSTGAIYLISKGGVRPPQVYLLPPDSWADRGPVTAESLESLPIDPHSLGNRVTDAALSPSGDRVAVRTYLAVYLFRFGGSSPPALQPTGIACDAAGLQLQGEGLTWLNEEELLLTSEGGFGTRGTLVVLGCGTAGPRLIPGPDRTTPSE